MKTTTITFLTVTVLLLGHSFGQPSDAEIKAALELTRSAVHTQRQAIIARNMPLTSEESSDFWKLYRDYQFDVRKVRDRSVTLIVDYAKAFEALSNEQADQMLKEWTDVEKRELDLKKKYMKKFSKVLPSKKVVRYFQLENKMDSVVKFDLAKQIPLVR